MRVELRTRPAEAERFQLCGRDQIVLVAGQLRDHPIDMHKRTIKPASRDALHCRIACVQSRNLSGAGGAMLRLCM
ncbi:MAG: hypothetical protein ACRDKY_06820 [Solirubrobacteraceae bacterium]